MRHVGKRISKRGLQAITEDAANYWWNKTQEQIQRKSESNMLNTNLNHSQLFQYSHLTFTCDKCQKEFQNGSLYSPSADKEELAQHPTYCSDCTKTTSLVPVANGKKKPKSKPKKNTVAYYQCLSACCQQGISPKKISQVASECKHNSLTILAARTNEIQKLNEAYRQIGESLTSLLQPIQE